MSSKAGIPPTVEPNSVDILTMIFVFSALHPDEWAQAVENVHRVRLLRIKVRLESSNVLTLRIGLFVQMLRPGGLLLFRDYGRNDLAMLRFKANRYMQDGLYVRGDNTRVYFFERGTSAPQTQPAKRDELTFRSGRRARSHLWRRPGLGEGARVVSRSD